MKPTLFHLGSFPVHSYGFMIAVGLVVGVAVAIRRGRSVGIDTGASLDLTFYAIVVGLVGARLLYVLVHAREYAQICRGGDSERSLGRILRDCSAALQFWQGGLVFLGGAVLAAVVILVYARRKRMVLGDVADVLAPSVSVAHVFGRLGCFLVGCCYGRPWAGGFSFPPGSVAYDELLGQHRFFAGATSTPPLHATQLYEAAGELLVFLGLSWLWPRRRFPGAIALTYAFAYGVLRFVLEIFRGDDVRTLLVTIRWPALARTLGMLPDEPLFVSPAQALSLALVVAAATTAIVLRRRASPTS